MAVPKKKTSKAKGRSRRASAWRARPPSLSLCECGKTRQRRHHACMECGLYRGRQVIDLD
ncbi:MAG: 50S ribosomal protein L32 [Acidimicrobiaceae bacterium]|nr:50S ribosomal protein L32 [Acidimicrobiaceae bacterium]MCY4176698.1 50S ribosomal protein L32 [Acidimicrobiaceae bacterium]MCY4281247.1 50S ribosomal protein L32 [Acidimicrobiaceae bacterium]MCY4294255.1 50S ribosomal protein L32 [Acidimicrobiaceae bacterium]